MSRNKNFLDWTDFTTPASGRELQNNSIRKTLKYDIYQDKTKFKAIALTDMQPLSQEGADIIAGTAYDLNTLAENELASMKNVRWVFRARILGNDSPHNFIPDPCDTTYVKKADDLSKAMSYVQMHTQFITPTDFDMKQGRGLVRQGDVVWVELDKNVVGYNLQMGRFLSKIKKDFIGGGGTSVEHTFYCDNLRDIFQERDATRVPIGASGPIEGADSTRASNTTTNHVKCSRHTELNDILQYEEAILRAPQRRRTIVRSAALAPTFGMVVKSRVISMANGFGFVAGAGNSATNKKEWDPSVAHLFPHMWSAHGVNCPQTMRTTGQKCINNRYLAAHPGAKPPGWPTGTPFNGEYCWRSPDGRSSTVPGEGYGYHWSAAYISYMLDFPGSGFPGGASHQKYARSGLTTRGIPSAGYYSPRSGYGDGTWETFSLWSETVEINVGDVLVEDKCYPGADHQSAHGDLVWQITGTPGNEVLWIAGGNLSDTNVTRIKIRAPNKLLGPGGAPPVASAYYSGRDWSGKYKVVVKKMR